MNTGVLIVTSVSRYLEWKYWHCSWFTADNLWRDFLEFPILSGILYGVISGHTRSGREQQQIVVWLNC